MPVIIPKLTKDGGRKLPPFIPLREREGAVEEWIKQTQGEVVKTPSPRRQTMRVRMVRTRPGGVDGGIRVEIFEEGKVYDMEEPLALAFLREGHAIEDKMIVAAPEVKDAVPAPAQEPEPPVTKPHKGRPKGRR